MVKNNDKLLESLIRKGYVQTYAVYGETKVKLTEKGAEFLDDLLEFQFNNKESLRYVNGTKATSVTQYQEMMLYKAGSGAALLLDFLNWFKA